MSEDVQLKNAIDRILSDRGKMRQKVDGEKSKIDNLIAILQSLKSRINETGDAEVTPHVSEIDRAIVKLTEAQRQAQIISERFNRNTVNIGVAGNTHAGKTTMLASISGATEDLLPKAPKEYDQSSTTAVRSEIYNCKSGDERVEISFKTATEFVKFINDYMSELPNKPYITTKELFKTFPLSTITCENNKQEYTKDRLLTLQKSYDDYTNLIGNTETLTLHRDRFKEVKQYVSYLYDGQKQYYPAVSEVKIYSNFGNVGDDVQLGLIDLPGFGENKNVDNIMLHGLQTKVDHAIQIFRTIKGGEGIQQKDSEKYDLVRDAVKEIKSFSDYMSFVINVDESIDNLESTISQIETKIGNQLNKSFTHPIYKAAGNSREKVKAPFLQIVQKLVNTLPNMDREVYNTYKENLQIDEVRVITDKVSSKIAQKAGMSGKTRDYNSQARRLRQDISFGIDQVKRTYNTESNSKFTTKADETHKKLEEEIKSMCFVPKDGYNDWDSWAFREYPATDGYRFYEIELQRLWAKLIYDYSEDMNRSYKDELDLLKNAIMGGIKKNTGKLLESTDIQELIDLLANNGELFHAIPDAFIWLNKIVLDFKHSMFSIIQEEKVRDIMDPKIATYRPDGQQGSNGRGNTTDFSTEKIVPSIKKQLQDNFKKANDKILEIIKKNEKTNLSLLAISEMFSDILIRFDDYDSEWATLFEQYGDKINETEDAIDWSSLHDLAKQAAGLLNELNK